MRKDDDSQKSIVNYKHLICVMRLTNFWEIKILKSYLKKNYIQNLFMLLLALWVQQSDMYLKLCMHFQQNEYND